MPYAFSAAAASAASAGIVAQSLQRVCLTGPLGLCRKRNPVTVTACSRRGRRRRTLHSTTVLLSPGLTPTVIIAAGPPYAPETPRPF